MPIHVHRWRPPALRLALAWLLATPAWAAEAPTPREGAAIFAPEPAAAVKGALAPPPPTFEGKSVVRTASGRFAPLRHPARAIPSTAAKKPSVTGYLGDLYIMDGSETAVDVNRSNGEDVVTAYNEGWDFDPDVPIGNSNDGNFSWGLRQFPTGQGIYGGYPFDPWVVSGNQAGLFLSTLIRNDQLPSDNSHIVISRSTDGGASFSPFYEKMKDVFQDREMVEIDRDGAHGGTTGTHDGKVFLCYDDYGPGGSGYVGSYLQVLSPAGAELAEYQVSGTGSPPFRGSQLQPVAGLGDGSLYLVGVSTAGGGSSIVATFDEIKAAGAGPNLYAKSTIGWFPVGQQLGNSGRWGLNGCRVDNHGYLDIDRSFGPRRGWLYFLTSRNPNPFAPAQDQGDLYLSISTDGAATWTTAQIPTVTRKTQYFPMLDVDDQGWIHVAYYQNVSGVENSGVLNAGSASVYYTVSRDGGQTWTPPSQVNAQSNALDFDQPPQDFSGVGYYMIGDYQQLRATGTGNTTRAYVLWTAWDKDRTDSDVGDKRERVYCTLLQTPAVPAAPGAWAVALAVALAGAGAATLVRRRRAA